MANVRISELNSATLDDTTVLPVVASGATKKTTAVALKTYTNTNTTLTSAQSLQMGFGTSNALTDVKLVALTMSLIGS